jgi:hypothetical protein
VDSKWTSLCNVYAERYQNAVNDMDLKDLKGERRARSSRLSVSPFGECPASLTEGGQPVVCWPGYETPERRKKLRSDEKKLSKIRGAAQPHVQPRSAYATSLTLESR